MCLPPSPSPTDRPPARYSSAMLKRFPVKMNHFRGRREPSPAARIIRPADDRRWGHNRWLTPLSQPSVPPYSSVMHRKGRTGRYYVRTRRGCYQSATLATKSRRIALRPAASRRKRQLLRLKPASRQRWRTVKRTDAVRCLDFSGKLFSFKVFSGKVFSPKVFCFGH
jgi:hypothetical protein